MSIEKRVFGVMPNEQQGQEIFLYSISNSRGMKADIMNYGATLVNLIVPDRNGAAVDVVTGYDNLAAYLGAHPYFGVVVGPNANRIGNATFDLDGKTYQLSVNDGVNNLHSHDDLGYQRRVWDVEENDASVTFSLNDSDGTMGFPGNKFMSVTYTVTEDNELVLVYHATSDQNTVINPTNHAYFNLGGHQKDTITNHLLTINASRFTVVEAGAIPNGELVDVAETPFDFLTAKPIGDKINFKCCQLELTGGYDHNWAIDGYDGTVREAARLTDTDSGITMTTLTDLPGIQFYAGNMIPDHIGKEGTNYRKRCALCLETQFFPDAVNRPEFVSAIFGPGKPYQSKTIYRFSCE
ncbi:MAG: galactose mutarotase [Lachnospiraceae bacterium]|jgi:aldose 1-epimerase|nr:galactose mutarotase [Lachnospiraceae bacterium]